MAEGAKKVLGWAADLTESIPIVGGIIGMLDKVVDRVYLTVKQLRFDNRVNAINRIIMMNKDENA